MGRHAESRAGYPHELDSVEGDGALLLLLLGGDGGDAGRARLRLHLLQEHVGHLLVEAAHPLPLQGDTLLHSGFYRYLEGGRKCIFIQQETFQTKIANRRLNILCKNFFYKQRDFFRIFFIVAAQNLQASWEKSEIHLRANLPTCYCKYVYSKSYWISLQLLLLPAFTLCTLFNTVSFICRPSDSIIPQCRWMLGVTQDCCDYGIGTIWQAHALTTRIDLTASRLVWKNCLNLQPCCGYLLAKNTVPKYLRKAWHMCFASDIQNS